MKFEFVLDDHRFLVDPRIQESGHIWDYFTNYVWAQFTGGAPSFYRPIFVLWLRINFILSGDSPLGWHLLSIAKHGLVAVLLGLLAWRLLRDAAAALLAATLFALHPAQTESVGWVTVPDPLMAAAMLGALLFYFRYMLRVGRAPEKKSKSVKKPQEWIWLLASSVAYFVALWAKETAIVFSVVIFALGFCTEPNPGELKRRSKSGHGEFRARLERGLRHVVPFVCVTVLYLLMRLNALGGKLGAATQHLPWSTILLSWPATIWFYVRVLLWPARSYAFADPSLVESFSGRGVLMPLVWIAGFAALLAAGLFFAWRRMQRDFGGQEADGIRLALVAGTLLLILPLLLTLNLNALNPGDFLHGRYTYLPLCGLMLLLAAGWHVAGRMQTALLCAATAVAIVFAVLTYRQEGMWRDDSTVFTIAHQLAPHNKPVAQNLANTRVHAALDLDQEGRCSEALPVFQEVIQEYPQDWFAWAGLGDCYVQLNDLTKAEDALHRAADISQNAHVIEQWQVLRSHMGLENSGPSK